MCYFLLQNSTVEISKEKEKDEGVPTAPHSVLLDVMFTAEVPVYLFINIIHP